MKNVLTGLVLTLSASLAAQNTFQVLDMDNSNAVVVPNTAIYGTVAVEDTHKANFDIINKSGSVQTYGVRRYDIVLNAAANSTAQAFFCFGGDCYTPGVMDSQNPVTLQPNQKTSELGGTYQSLLAELTEAETAGLSYVKYTFYNVNDANDTIQFSLRYNDATVGLQAQQILKPGLSLAPNPAHGNVQAMVTMNAAGKCSVTIHNALGALVNASEVTVIAGTSSLDLDISSLKKGVYFVSVNTGGTTAVKRLIVE